MSRFRPHNICIGGTLLWKPKDVRPATNLFVFSLEAFLDESPKRDERRMTPFLEGEMNDGYRATSARGHIYIIDKKSSSCLDTSDGFDYPAGKNQNLVAYENPNGGQPIWTAPGTLPCSRHVIAPPSAPTPVMTCSTPLPPSRYLTPSALVSTLLGPTCQGAWDTPRTQGANFSRLSRRCSRTVSQGPRGSLSA